MTGTPRVSSTSRVFGRSRIALAPLATTVTGVCASSSRSAEMSKLASAPRCTPPMPPVAKTSMPARRAAIMVAATVVEPVAPSTSATARSARESLRTPRASASQVEFVRRQADADAARRTAIVAGMAPPARTSASTARAVSMFSGAGMPWVMMVDFERDQRPAGGAGGGDLVGKGERQGVGKGHGSSREIWVAAAARAVSSAAASWRPRRGRGGGRRPECRRRR